MISERILSIETTIILPEVEYLRAIDIECKLEEFRKLVNELYNLGLNDSSDIWAQDGMQDKHYRLWIREKCLKDKKVRAVLFEYLI